MEDEVLKILKLVEEGKLSAADAEKLIEALNIPAEQPARSGAKFVKIRISSASGENVNVNLPFGLVKFARNLIPGKEVEKMNEHGICIDELLAALDSNESGELVNIESPDGDSVRIWVE